MTVEQRSISRPLELRAEGDAPPRIAGYAAVFYRAEDPATQFQLWPGAFERIARSAFDEALKRDDVRALFNHDSSKLLGRNKSGTLKLSVDDVGLRYEIEPSDSQTYRDLAESLKRGDVDGSSFQFSVVGEDVWYRDDSGNEIRELRNVKLYDVGPATFPAYAGSSASTRCDEARASYEAQRRLQIEAEERERFILLTSLRQS